MTEFAVVGKQEGLTAFAPKGQRLDRDFFGGENLYLPNKSGFAASDAMFTGTWVPNTNGVPQDIYYNINGQLRPAAVKGPDGKSIYYVPRRAYEQPTGYAGDSDEELPQNTLQAALKAQSDNPEGVYVDPSSGDIKMSPWGEETQQKLQEIRTAGIFGTMGRFLDEKVAPAMAATDVFRGTLMEGVIAAGQKSPLTLALPTPGGAALIGWALMSPKEREAAMKRAVRGRSPGLWSEGGKLAQRIDNPHWRAAMEAALPMVGGMLDGLMDPALLLGLGVNIGSEVSLSLGNREARRAVTSIVGKDLSTEAAERVAKRIGPVLGQEGFFAEAVVEMRPQVVKTLYQRTVQAILPEVRDLAQAERVAQQVVSQMRANVSKGVRVAGRRIQLRATQPIPSTLLSDVDQTVERGVQREAAQVAEQGVTAGTRVAEAQAGRFAAPEPGISNVQPEAPGTISRLGEAETVRVPLDDARRAAIIAERDRVYAQYQAVNAIEDRPLTESEQFIKSVGDPRRSYDVTLERGYQEMSRQNADALNLPVAPQAATSVPAAAATRVTPPANIEPGADVIARIYPGGDPTAVSQGMRDLRGYTWPEWEPLPENSVSSRPHLSNRETMHEAMRGYAGNLRKNLNNQQLEALGYYIQTSGRNWTTATGQRIAFTPADSLELLLKQTGEWKDGLDLAKLSQDPALLKQVAPSAALVKQTAGEYQKFLASFMTSESPVGVSVPDMMKFLHSHGDAWAVDDVGDLGRGYFPRVGGTSPAQVSGSRISPVPQDVPGTPLPGAVGRFAYHSTYTRPLDELMDAVEKQLPPQFSIDPAKVVNRYTEDVNDLYDRYMFLREVIGDEAAGVRGAVNGRSVRVVDDAGQRMALDYGQLQRNGWVPLTDAGGIPIGPTNAQGERVAAYWVPKSVQAQFVAKDVELRFNQGNRLLNAMEEMIGPALPQLLQNTRTVAGDSLRLAVGAFVTTVLTTKRFLYQNIIEQPYNWFMGSNTVGDANAANLRKAYAVIGRDMMQDVEFRPESAIRWTEAKIGARFYNRAVKLGVPPAEIDNLLTVARDLGVLHSGPAGTTREFLSTIGSDSNIARWAAATGQTVADAGRGILQTLTVMEDEARLASFYANWKRYGDPATAAKVTFQGFVDYSAHAYHPMMRAFAGYLLFLRYPIGKFSQLVGWTGRHPVAAPLIAARMGREGAQTAEGVIPAEMQDEMAPEDRERVGNVWNTATRWGRNQPYDPSLQWWPDATLPEASQVSRIAAERGLNGAPDRRVVVYSSRPQVPMEQARNVVQFAQNPSKWMLNHLSPPLKFLYETLQTGNMGQAWQNATPTIAPFQAAGGPALSAQQQIISEAKRQQMLQGVSPGAPGMPVMAMPRPEEMVASEQRQRLAETYRMTGVALREEIIQLKNIPLDVLENLIEDSEGLPDSALPFSREAMQAYLIMKQHGDPRGGTLTREQAWSRNRR